MCRLSEVREDGSLTATYEYDANGNRLAHIAGNDTTSGTYDNQDRMLAYGDAEYVYSLFGDLKWRIVGTDTTKFTYDAFGSLVSVEMPNGDVIEYLLDGNGTRVGRKLNGTVTQKWLYSNNLRIVAELDSNNAVAKRFVYTVSENVPEYMVTADTAYRFVTDHLGSVRQVLNTETGEIKQEIEYDEFGNVLTDSNPGFSPFGFAGGLYETSTGLVRFGARDYEAISGRWITKDPIRFNSDDSNLYAYVWNNPLSFIDVEGTYGTADQGAFALGNAQSQSASNTGLAQFKAYGESIIGSILSLAAVYNATHTFGSGAAINISVPSDIISDYNFFAGHKKARPSTENKHEEGQARGQAINTEEKRAFEKGWIPNQNPKSPKGKDLLRRWKQWKKKK